MATVPNSKDFARSRTVAGAHLALIGCNHRTAPVELRERVAFTSEQALEAAGELRRRGILEEAVVLSTCNRSELYGVPATSGPGVTDAMEDFLTSYHRIPRAELHGRTYRWFGSDAVRHLFRVAAGLDSMLLGEAEILGQLRTAYGQALDNGSTGPMLNRAFQGALEVGKRVRSETEVGARPMSVALAGVKLAERVFGNLKGHSALIVGAGAVAEQVVEHLRNRGIGSLRVANRSHNHAAELAERVDGEAVDWASLEDVLGAPDIIVTSVGGGAVLTREMLDAALAAREGARFLWWTSECRAMSIPTQPVSTICISITSTISVRSSSRTNAPAKPKSRALRRSSPNTWPNSNRGERRSRPVRSWTIFVNNFAGIASTFARTTREWRNISPEERSVSPASPRN